MSSRPSSLSFPWLHLTLFFYCWNIRIAIGSQINVTVDDTDPSIVYQPSASWHASSTACPTCLNPGTSNAFLNTYHDGTHVLVTTDEGTESDEEEVTNKGGKGRGKGGGGKKERRLVRALLDRRLDPDDPGFVDPPVTAEFQFNGSAIYLYCIQPLGMSSANTAPTAMNLSFTLDNSSYGHFVHSASQSASNYLPHVNVFAQKNLAETPHVLRVNVEAGSVFLFDYLIYTQTNDTMTNSNASTTPLAQDSPGPSPSPTSTVDPKTKHHNVATFAGAVGGCVGFLAILSMGLACSIIKRRRNYKYRERLASRGSRNGSDNSPIFGPIPFIPRFFPGTVIPTDPPPYEESRSMSSSSHEASLPMLSSSVVPASYNAHLAQRGDIAYADIPPASLPPLENNEIIPPPPSFTEAIATFPSTSPSILPSPPGLVDEMESVPHERNPLVSDNPDSTSLLDGSQPSIQHPSSGPLS